jgi:predicted RNA-binding Zn-ribbon protein involved in translation (DUF1610 family)
MNDRSDKKGIIDEAVARFMREAGPDLWWQRGERKWESVRMALQAAGISRPRGGEWQDSADVSTYYRTNKVNIDKILSEFVMPAPRVEGGAASFRFFFLSCPNCGNTAGRDSTACNTCGESLSLSEDATSFILTYPLCPACGERVARNDISCRNCRRRLLGPCFKCGHPYSRTEEARCPNCGLDGKEEAQMQWESDQERRSNEERFADEKDFAAAKVWYDKAKRNYAWADKNLEHISTLFNKVQRECADGSNSEKLERGREDLARAEADLDSAERDLEYWETYFTGAKREPEHRRNEHSMWPRGSQALANFTEDRKAPLTVFHVVGGIGATLFWLSLFWMYYFGLGKVGPLMFIVGAVLFGIAMKLQPSKPR